MNSYHFACIIQYIVVDVSSYVVDCRKHIMHLLGSNLNGMHM